MKDSKLQVLCSVKRLKSIKIMFFVGFLACFNPAWAEIKRSPNDVYAGIDYAEKMLDLILEDKGITIQTLPTSKEKKVLPMHVYELHVASLQQLYNYSLANNLTPPPLVASTPIQYTPTDVYFLTKLITEKLESIFADTDILNIPYKETFKGKTPVDVFNILFRVYYKIHRLNGIEKVSPNEVFAQVGRVKEDLQNMLLAISKRLPPNQEAKKRQLVTAIYGLSPNGETLPAKSNDKKPKDVIALAFEVRKKLNTLRKNNKLPEIPMPSVNDYAKVLPVDVFLQTQFIIAEINLLKRPFEVSSTTNSPKAMTGKIPSDVYYDLKHVEYMLQRLITVL